MGNIFYYILRKLFIEPFRIYQRRGRKEDRMKSNRPGSSAVLVLFLSLLIALPILTLTASAQELDEIDVGPIEEIPELTLPPTNPCPDADVDVFERLDLAKEAGEYLADKPENIGDNFYFTTKQGFDYIHLSGTPHEIGYNQAILLYEKIERGMAAYAYLTEYRYSLTWPMCRFHGATYWPNIPTEYQQEIDGIAQGCQEVGANNPDGSTIDRWDIVAYNAIWDIWWRTSEIRSFPPFPFFEVDPIHHCSGFVANGDFTKDQGFVIAQSLWMPYYLPPSHGVFADILPQSGNRMLMELQAGMIWSGTEWYLNSAGLVVGETTLGNAPYQWLNVPAFVRIRKAVQYANTIDEFANIMVTDTNGAYCGDYMVCDAKNNEVGIVELGSYEYEVWRSENGFHGSCNYPWDPEVQQEMEVTPGWEHGCYPRYYRLAQIANKYKGQIDTEIAKRTLGDHWDTVEEKENRYHWTLCGHVENASGYPHGSLDGKCTNQSMVLNYECWARYGHSCGNDFIAADHAAKNPDYAWSNLKDMIAKPWTTFGFLEPIVVKVIDKHGESVENAQIAFENCADLYLAEGYTDSTGVYQFQYFQTGTYNITARNEDDSLRGTVHVNFNQQTTIEIVISEWDERSGLGSPALIALVVMAIVVVAVVIIAVLVKKFRKP